MAMTELEKPTRKLLKTKLRVRLECCKINKICELQGIKKKKKHKFCEHHV